MKIYPCSGRLILQGQESSVSSLALTCGSVTEITKHISSNCVKMSFNVSLICVQSCSEFSGRISQPQYLFKKIFYLFIFRERGRERNINVTDPTMYACALTGD